MLNIWSQFIVFWSLSFFLFFSLCKLIYVCMYVCMYVSMDTCMHAWMYVCMYACMHVFMYVCMYACMYVCCMYVCMLYVCIVYLDINKFCELVYIDLYFHKIWFTNASLDHCLLWISENLVQFFYINFAILRKICGFDGYSERVVNCIQG